MKQLPSAVRKDPKSSSTSSQPFFVPPSIQKNIQSDAFFGETAADLPVQSKHAPKRSPGVKPSQLKPNTTGLPADLKTRIEQASGFSMDDVKVHYNSNKPDQLEAHAYAQGGDIHIAPGQEKHLPHEAWHVIQQKQGRVQPISQKNGVNVNDDKNLEKEADVMGNKASETKGAVAPLHGKFAAATTVTQRIQKEEMIQNTWYYWLNDSKLQRMRFLGTQNEGDVLRYQFYDPVTKQTISLDPPNVKDFHTEEELTGNHLEIDNSKLSEVILSLTGNFNKLQSLIREEGINTTPNGIKAITMADRLLSYCLEWEDAVNDYQKNRDQFVSRLSPETWSSCFNTASRLYNLLGAGDAISQTKGQKLRSEAIQAKRDINFIQLQTIVNAFLADINAYNGVSQRVYNCAYGIHGFSVIMRRGNIEILQSFANGVNKRLPNSTIAESVMSGRIYSVNDFATLFRNMAANNNDDQRHDAQAQMFSSWLEDNDQVFPFLNFEWNGKNLKNSSDIIVAVFNRINENLLVLKKLMPDKVTGRGDTIKGVKDLYEFLKTD